MSVIEESSDQLHVLIIGCGNIAGGYDVACASDALSLSDAGAYTSDRCFIVTACVEPNENERLAFRLPNLRLL